MARTYDLDARRAGGIMGSRDCARPIATVAAAALAWEPRSSLYRLLGGGLGPVGGASLGSAIHFGALEEARVRLAAPAGAKGFAVVSMYQIASDSLRAMSTRAIFFPRWVPRRVVVRW